MKIHCVYLEPSVRTQFAFLGDFFAVRTHKDQFRVSNHASEVSLRVLEITSHAFQVPLQARRGERDEGGEGGGGIGRRGEREEGE